MSVSQPRSLFDMQCANPALHADGANVQAPLTHVSDPVTFARAVQSWPHIPQLRTSFGMHEPLQLSCADKQSAAGPASAASVSAPPSSTGSVASSPALASPTG
jgi:hypothetical protein